MSLKAWQTAVLWDELARRKILVALRPIIPQMRLVGSPAGLWCHWLIADGLTACRCGSWATLSPVSAAVCGTCS